MNRRKFLSVSGVTVASAAVVGGTGSFLYLSDRSRRLPVYRELLASISSNSTRVAHHELQTLPVLAREDIRTWFHGKCLNCAPFATEVTRSPFIERLRLLSEQDQHLLLANAFYRYVVTESEVTNRCQVIADEAGSQLSSNWANICNEIADRWSVSLNKAPAQTLTHAILSEKLDSLVRKEIDNILRSSQVGTNRPALGQTVGSIGQNAMALLPFSHISAHRILSVVGSISNFDGNVMVIPAFLFTAIGDLCRFIMSLFADTSKDVQSAVSARLAVLANRIGSEMEASIKTLIGDLHSWQTKAIEIAAWEYSRFGGAT